MFSSADLLLVDGALFVGSRGHIAQVERTGRNETLCAAAIIACEHGRLQPRPADLEPVGVVDVQRGEVRLRSGAHTLVQAAWGVHVDRSQLASVMLDRERDETQEFRAAVLRRDVGTIARLGPRRGFRW